MPFPVDHSPLEGSTGDAQRPDRRRGQRQPEPRWWRSPVLPPGLVIVASLVVAVVVGTPADPARAQESSGAALYAQFCASCHQAGGEGIPEVFPPLLGNPAAADADNVADAIMNGRSGPVEILGVAYDQTMEPVPELADADLDSVVAFVTELAASGLDGAEPAEEPTAGAPVAETPLVGDPSRGHDLFRGSTTLDNRGAACASCHTAGSIGNLGGSSLGPDLSSVFTTLGGEAGLIGWLGNPPSRTMSPIYAERPLADAEIADLAAFLATTPDTGPPDGSIDGLLVASAGGVIVLLGGMAIAWRGMRQTYHQRLRSKP